MILAVVGLVIGVIGGAAGLAVLGGYLRGRTLAAAQPTAESFFNRIVYDSHLIYFTTSADTGNSCLYAIQRRAR